MNIEYAKFTLTPTFVHRYDLSPDIIKNNSQLLIKAYNEYKASVIKKSKETQAEYDLKEQIFNSKKCQYCGGKLVYRKDYDFWGCTNYKSEGQHSSFSKLEPLFYSSHVTVADTWLTDIIKNAGFKGKLKAKPLFDFYISNGLSDIRTDFGYSSTETRIDVLKETKKRSIDQELLFKKHFETLGKVAYQQCITYKLADKKESFCIPDFILGTNKEVKVIDAKLDYPNDEKMNLYVCLVKFILDQKKDQRAVHGAHAFYPIDKTYYLRESKYETIIL